MKNLTIILAIYLLGLNFAPCSDTIADNDDVQTEYSQATDGDHNHNSSDLCSPFCQCHCCHMHTIDFGLIPYVPFQPYISNEVFAYSQNAGKNFPISLLQPPRA
ncbi:DUF6660 family protein [Maribacter sp. ACAM166]|uniref:DUF6660 family protein n=1 Tax=Maribacter sp. ACAM166 TaxID=2508996 RepID=UPI0010FDFA8C|nr:DUF6660 family protein [Maribacter sp. ACAM166]TLP79781.1 hypothetical protein ES765_09900 [Maribacter sp. ACAM166]